jgi:ABC-type transport system substrate-binding protein
LTRKKFMTLIFGLTLLLSAFLLPATFFTRGQTTLFKITLTTPSTNPSRQEWSEIIQQEFASVGIECERVIQDWDTIYDRALDPPPDIAGKTFDEGGFDMLFVGYAMDVDPDPSSLYLSSQTTTSTPPGQNYYCWENTQAYRQHNKIKTTV